MLYVVLHVMYFLEFQHPNLFLGFFKSTLHRLHLTFLTFFVSVVDGECELLIYIFF